MNAPVSTLCRLLAWAAIACASPAFAQPTVADRPAGTEAASAGADDSVAPQLASRLQQPSAEAVRAASGKVRDVFADDFAAAKTPDKKRELAARLGEQAAATHDPAERWVILSEALRLAIDGGDAAVGLVLIERIPSEFAVENADAGRLEAMTRLAAKVSPADGDTVGREMLNLARRWVEAGAQPLATKAVAAVTSLARKTKNADLLAAAARFQAEQKEQQKEAKNEAAIVEKLQQSPHDPDVCLEAGRFYCFRMNDWDKGLPLLAAGSHSGMAQAAKSELASAKNPGQFVNLGDRWWEVAEGEAAATKGAVQAHAGDLYRRGIGSLSGLDKVRVEKRIAAAAAASRQSGGSPAKRMPGLVLWLDAGDLQSFDPPMRRGGEATRISVWRDLSGRGNDARQPDPSRQPLWSPEAFDASPGLVFSGGQTLAVPMPCGRAGTILVTLRPKAAGNMRFLGCYRNQGEHVGLCLRSDGSVWAEAMMPGNSAAVARSNASAYRAEAKLLLGQSWGKSLALIGAGSVPAAPFTAGADVFPGPWGIGGAFLKQQIEYFSGVLGEVLVFDRELTAAEQEGVSGELAAKWRCR